MKILTIAVLIMVVAVLPAFTGPVANVVSAEPFADAVQNLTSTTKENDMTITRINNFEAKPGIGDELKGALETMLPVMTSSTGFHSYEILQGVDVPENIVIVEVWDSVEDHQAAVATIAKESFGEIMALLAEPPSGTYYLSGDKQ